eukprot:CAMPEP_0174347630 /NCGR_PEP_ID=MMETSP0811_2-20130205/3758_1 /TAXON_ID=73025 ORGANISM="Eutreptiella gymnastica-like, Strain CCMP1594" /NCGR_SAMPLE_ID=MMETSP0811_2 /ASSEMBLY_ACC=CAM_ASM_000667 /LENGTH=36 /DNA_ID= /DNA_START= /DNA_END= /DNA_ORIENTATION=
MKEASRGEEPAQDGHRQNMKSDNSDPWNLVMERKCA